MNGQTEYKWIAVDLDGTLAEDSWGTRYYPQIGRPVPLMLERVKRWLARGIDVRILTARVASTNPAREENRATIKVWLKMHIGKVLPITAEKDPLMVALWDDKAVQIIPNTGIRADRQEDAF